MTGVGYGWAERGREPAKEKSDQRGCLGFLLSSLGKVKERRDEKMAEDGLRWVDLEKRLGSVGCFEREGWYWTASLRTGSRLNRM